MPSTKTPRKSRTNPSVNYNPIFPGGRNQDRPDNQAARVAVGDREVGIRIRRDYEASYGTKKKK